LNVAIIGASGFVGRNLVRGLVGAGFQIRLLTHRSKSEFCESNHIKIAGADIHDKDSLITALNGIDVIYHLVGIIAETKHLTFEKTVVQGTANLIEACSQNCVKKIIYLSALGTSEDAKTKYHRAKWAAERIVRGSKLEYIILRPSATFGPEDKFINMLANMIRKSPLIPVIGDGCYQMQPIFIDDLIKIMINSLENSAVLNRVIEIGGPEQLQFRAIIALLGKVLKKKSVIIYIPVFLARFGAHIMENLMKPSPLTVDQIEMLLYGNIFSNNELNGLFDVKLTSFENGIAKYLR
jgi:uncharacterized protein YbjT (DUF2867 family)